MSCKPFVLSRGRSIGTVVYLALACAFSGRRAALQQSFWGVVPKNVLGPRQSFVASPLLTPTPIGPLQHITKTDHLHDDQLQNARQDDVVDRSLPDSAHMDDRLACQRFQLPERLTAARRLICERGVC